MLDEPTPPMRRPIGETIRRLFHRAWQGYDETRRAPFDAAGQDHDPAPVATASPLPKIEEMTPGAASGIEHHELVQRPGSATTVAVTCTDYSPERVQVERVKDLVEFVGRHRPEWSVVRWINIDGLTDMNVIRTIAEKYDLHPLAVEDVIQVPQRPKVEDYPISTEHQARLFVIARMLTLIDGHLHAGKRTPPPLKRWSARRQIGV
jgi:magnesium transporter